MDEVRIGKLMPSPTILTLLGAMAVACAAFASIGTNVPTVVSPHSLPVIFLPLSLGDWILRHVRSDSLGRIIYYSVVLVPIVAGFATWSFPLLMGRRQIPRRSLLLLTALGVLCAAYLMFGLRYGLKYHGTVYTTFMVCYNVLAVCGLFFLYCANRKAPEFWSNLTFHTGLFSWLAWCAFPWLGELI